MDEVIGRIDLDANSPATGKAISRSTGVPTLTEVAKLAGVSPITVSRALNQPEKVAPGTADKVRRAIEWTGFVPNLMARGLAGRKSRLVAAIVPTVSSTVFSAVIQFLTDRLWESDYQLLLGTSGCSSSHEDDLLLAILSRRPDAIVLTGITHSRQSHRRLIMAKIPVMELRELTATPVDMLVGFSHEKVGQSVAELFTDKGHRRFAVVSTRDARAEVRKAGFLSTLERHGFTESVVADVPVPSNFRMGREGLRQILESGFRPQAVFCSSDFLAHGVLAEAQAQGLSVPEDLAIVGFIDLDFAAYTSPPLSTVRVDREGIGRKAADAILAAIEGRNKDRIVDVGFQIIERGTT